MDIVQAVERYGLSIGLLLGAVYYILFQSVPLKVWEKECEQNAKLADAVGQLAERLGVLIDRGR